MNATSESLAVFDCGLLESASKQAIDIKEVSNHIELKGGSTVELRDVLYVERTPRAALFEQCASKPVLGGSVDETTDSRAIEGMRENLTDEERAKIKKATSWSDKIIDNIANMNQYEILKSADLVEAEVGGRKCLIKEKVDLDYVDKDGISNRDRMSRGLAPLDKETGKPIELHHLGQKSDSPLVELTEEEHRTGECIDGKKNQSVMHDNTIKSEVHGEGNKWTQDRKLYWKERFEISTETNYG